MHGSFCLKQDIHMATIHNNLSEYDVNKVPNASEMKIGIAVAEWNHEITNGLLQGAIETLKKHGVTENNLIVEPVPGSYELPLAAQWIIESKNVDAVICLGSVIRGETEHFTFVCEAVGQGCKDVSLKTGKAVVFGVLTDNNIEQSRARSGGIHGNKGDEAAITAIKMVDLQNRLGK